MVSTFTPNKNLEQPANNDDVDTWDVPVNANMTAIDTAFGGSTSLNATGLSGTVALVTAQYQPLSLLISGAPSGNLTYSVPSGVGGMWIVRNDCTGSFTVGLVSLAGGSTINVPSGTATVISCDGSGSGMRLGVSTPPPAAGSTTQVQYNNSGVLGASANLVFDGTTLTTTGLSNSGSTVLGNSAGDTLSIGGTAVAIPNGLTLGGGIISINAANDQVGIGTASYDTNLLTVAGTIQSTSGGYRFPDNTVQLTAAGPTSPGGSDTQVQFNNAGSFGGNAGFTYNGTVVSANVALTNGSVANTQSAGDNSTLVATTAYADGAASTAGTVALAAAIGQVVATQTTAFSQNNTVMPLGGVVNNTPVITDGSEYMTRTITPKAANSILTIDVVFVAGTSSGSACEMTVALFQDSTVNALKSVMQVIGVGPGVVAFRFVMTAGSTASTTFRVRAGTNTGDLIYFNGFLGLPILGGTSASSITVREDRQ